MQVTLDNSSLSVGATAQATATKLDAAGHPISNPACNFSLSSSDASVATVSSSGLVVAVHAGSATITAQCALKSGSATVTVHQSETQNVELGDGGYFGGEWVFPSPLLFSPGIARK
ncbi:MAG: Ig-like domain-containing protein [bacterium]